MPIFDICWQIQDGERTYSQYEKVIAKNKTTAEKYAEECLIDWYGEEETVWDPEKKIATEKSGETAVKVLFVSEIKNLQLYDLDRYGWASASIVLDTPSIISA